MKVGVYQTDPVLHLAKHANPSFSVFFASLFPLAWPALSLLTLTVGLSRIYNGVHYPGDVLALEIVRVWLETPFEGGRHRHRIDKFDQIDISRYLK